MKFTVTKWTIKKLFESYSRGKLNLSPSYQRNFIWSIDDQKYLIDSILRNNPIPNFFLLEKSKNNFEMVDGQQRSRTILSYIGKGFSNSNDNYFDIQNDISFLDYTFPVTIITDVEHESIEHFYAIVNKTGVHLNKPEVRKADYYDTNLLKLITTLTSSKKIKTLNLFSDSSLKRMNDTDFISELIIYLLRGHIDKKNLIDDYFKKDISLNDSKRLKQDFEVVIDKILELNKLFEISKSRYKQRNDFYSLFDFIHKNEPKIEDLKTMYKILICIGSDIKPSQEACIPFMEYARNCITQSNSKAAREKRYEFYQELFLNESNQPNSTQLAIMKFYGHKNSKLIKIGNYNTISLDKLTDLKEVKFKL